MNSYIYIYIYIHPFDHRFDGWNLDPLWQTGAPERKWDGKKYQENEVIIEIYMI